MSLFRLAVLVCPVVGLLAGFITGCTTKDSEGAPYQPPLPIVKYGSNSDDLKTWDLTTPSIIALQDQIDFSNANPSSLLITTRCMVGKVEANEHFEFKARSSVKIFEIIPKHLFAKDFSKSDTHCSFEIALISSNGSKHTFPASQNTIVESLNTEIAYQSDKQTFAFRKYEGIDHWYDVELLCEDLRIDGKRVQQEFNLNHFVATNIGSDGMQTNYVNIEKPFQKCRVLEIDNKKVTQISPLFEVKFAPKPLHVGMLSHGRDEIKDNLSVDHFKELTLLSIDFLMAYYSITNDSSGTRTLLIPFQSLSATYQVVEYVRTGRYDEATVLTSYEGNWLKLVMNSSKNGAEVTSTDNGWKVVLPPSASIKFNMYASSLPKGGCNKLARMGGIIIAPKESITISEVDSTGRAYNETSLVLPDIAVLGLPQLNLDKILSIPKRNSANCEF